MTELIQEIALDCPYCGETVTIAVEADLSGELIQDCEVCCNPWRLQLSDSGGRLRAEVASLDG